VENGAIPTNPAAGISVGSSSTAQFRHTPLTPQQIEAVHSRVDTPKTKESLRTVPLESWLADELRDYLSYHPRAHENHAPLFPGRLTMQAAMALGRNTKDSGDRFDWSVPIDVANVYDRYLQPALSALKLPAARWHDLRHSYAVNMLSYGNVSIERLRKWMGHRLLSMTQDVYGDYVNADVFKPAGIARPVASTAEDRGNIVRIASRRTS
jgi:integrase